MREELLSELNEPVEEPLSEPVQVSVLLYPGLLDFCPSGFLSSGGSVGVHALLVCNLWAVVRSGSARNLSVLTVKLSCGLNRFGIFQR